jgi:hypothetical protein
MFVRQITARGWFSQFASLTALVIAFLFAPEHPLHAQTIPFMETLTMGLRTITTCPIHTGKR